MQSVRTRNIPPPPAPRRRSRLKWVIAALVLLAVGAFVIRPFWQLTSQFDDLTFRQPSRLYAKATRIAPGRSYPASLLISDLEAEGYREDTDTNPLPAGRYRKDGRGLDVHLRSFPWSRELRGVLSEQRARILDPGGAELRRGRLPFGQDGKGY